MSESLNCYFYKYEGDPRVADKQFPAPEHAEYSCSTIQPLEPLSDLDIRLIIDYPVQSGENVKPPVMNCNYVAIDGLYYKITNKERLPANALAIYATIDGVTSYWSQISSCAAICKRSTDKLNSFIYDPMYQTYTAPFNSYGSFGSSFGNETQIVLTYIK